MSDAPPPTVPAAPAAPASAVAPVVPPWGTVTTPTPPAPADPYAKRPAAPAPVSGVSDMDRNVDAMMAPPPRATSYKISVPGAIDQADVPEITQAFHARGMSQGDLDVLLLAVQGHTSNPLNNLQPEVAEKKVLEKLRAKWGASYDENVAYAQSEARELLALSPRLEAWLTDKRLGSHQQVVERLAARGRYRASRSS